MTKKRQIKKECKKHGVTEYILEGRGYYRCKLCRTENVAKCRKNMKKKAVKYKGGKCSICGYDRCMTSLIFHHTEGDKEFGISQKGKTRKWETIKKELDKCMLVCANCHGEIHEQ